MPRFCLVVKTMFCVAVYFHCYHRLPSTVHDDNPGYTARFEAAFFNEFHERVAAMKSIEILLVATALDPRYKYISVRKCERTNPDTYKPKTAFDA